MLDFEGNLCGIYLVGGLTKAAFSFARNDALANATIIAAGLVTANLWNAAYPDVIIGWTRFSPLSSMSRPS